MKYNYSDRWYILMLYVHVHRLWFYHELALFWARTLVPSLGLFPPAKLLEDAATLLRLSLVWLPASCLKACLISALLRSWSCTDSEGWRQWKRALHHTCNMIEMMTTNDYYKWWLQMITTKSNNSSLTAVHILRKRIWSITLMDNMHRADSTHHLTLRACIPYLPVSKHRHVWTHRKM